MNALPLSWDEVYFANPWAFGVVIAVLLGPLLLSVVSRTVQNQSKEDRFVSSPMYDRLTDDADRSSGLRPWAIALIWLTCLSISVGLTRPQWGVLEQTVQHRGLDIIIAMDLSGSMRAADPAPSRLETAHRELAFLVSGLEGNRLGLVGFAGAAFLFCPLTLDTNAVELFLDEMTIEAVPVPGTALGEAVRVALDTFEASDAEEGGSKVILLLTDGEDHESEPLKWAQRAADAGVIIDTIGVGSSEGALVPDAYGRLIRDESGEPVVSKLDGSLLREMSDLTGGVFLRVDSANDTLDPYLESLKKREMRHLGSELEVTRQERFPLFLGLAAALFLLSMILLEVDKRR